MYLIKILLNETLLKVALTESKLITIKISSSSVLEQVWSVSREEVMALETDHQ